MEYYFLKSSTAPSFIASRGSIEAKSHLDALTHIWAGF
jgi:hypothetical protein